MSNETDRDRQTDRDRHRHTDTERQRHTQRDTQRDRNRDRQTERQTETDTEREREMNVRWRKRKEWGDRKEVHRFDFGSVATQFTTPEAVCANYEFVNC